MCSILPNTFIKHLITILSQDLQCVWTKLILLYAFMMSADVACNITLNGFVNPRVYEQTFRATINVGFEVSHRFEAAHRFEARANLMPRAFFDAARRFEAACRIEVARRFEAARRFEDLKSALLKSASMYGIGLKCTDWPQMYVHCGRCLKCTYIEADSVH